MAGRQERAQRLQPGRKMCRSAALLLAMRYEAQVIANLHFNILCIEILECNLVHIHWLKSERRGRNFSGPEPGIFSEFPMVPK